MVHIKSEKVKIDFDYTNPITLSITILMLPGPILFSQMACQYLWPSPQCQPRSNLLGLFRYWRVVLL